MAQDKVIEQHDPSVGSVFEATESLVDTQSAWQSIRLIQTARHGKVLFLDGICMLTESTHFVYHELMTHVSMACVPNPKHVLVIGGGDGGTVTELVKYPALETITLVELDEAVTIHCQQHMPALTEGLDDPRVTCIFGDGAAHVAAASDGQYDLIIIDSTDVCDEGSAGDDIAMPLATAEFYAATKRVLSPQGVIAQVHGSPHFYGPALQAFWHQTVPLWPQFRPMMMPCPFYISGDWCAGLMSVSGALNPVHKHDINGPLHYFNEAVALGALALPNFVEAMLPSRRAHK